jgi:hypothetical protein
MLRDLTETDFYDSHREVYVIVFMKLLGFGRLYLFDRVPSSGGREGIC